MIQFNPPSVIDGFVIIDSLLEARIVIEPTNDPAAYKSVVPPLIDSNGDFWLAVSETQKALTQQVLDSIA